LIVEIISPESSGRDRGEKFYEYEMAGVREYWLIDPQREQVEFYELNAEGRYTLLLGGC
jgi:Uma2 family endonuclease